jgi:hypothetical protein
MNRSLDYNHESANGHNGHNGRDDGGAAPARAIAACTIVSRNYFSHAKILAASFLRHEPGGRFYILVVDDLPDAPEADPGPGVTLVGIGDIGLRDPRGMCLKYDVVELNTAVKPAFLATLLYERGEEDLVYLDPDIEVMRPLEAVKEALGRADIVLTPHVLSPIPLDGLHPSDQDILISGAYNLGFVALRRSPMVREFLAWWGERLEELCRIDVAHGLFTDQRWVDLVPAFFPSVAVLRDPTCNVAFWNLHERQLSRRGDDYFVNDRPVTFFHYSGFNPNRRLTLSKHQDRVAVEKGSALADLLDHYADLQIAHGFDTCSKWGYGHNHFDNGVAVSRPLRLLYLGLDPRTRAWFGDPFRTGGGNSFLGWATRPRPWDAGLSRFLRQVYEIRTDVAAAFPDVTGKDRERFIEWARNQGPGEMGYEADLVQVSAEAAVDAAEYEELVNVAGEVSAASIPPGASAAVVSNGDERLLRAPGRTFHHFPCSDDGRCTHLGHNPEDSAEAVAMLESLRGAGFLVVPATAFWWLSYYGEFRAHLAERYREVPLPREDACVVFDLAGRKPAGTAAHRQAKEAVHRRLVRRVRDDVESAVPAGADVLVVSKGDNALLRLGNRLGGHFPQAPGGGYPGYNPADAADAIAQLEALRRRGAEYLVLPNTAFWWLEHYAEFRRHLDSRCWAVRQGEDCVIYRLEPVPGASDGEAATTAAAAVG